MDNQPSKYCFRHSGASTPRLAFAQSFWALSERTISISQALEEAEREGYEYFEVGLRSERVAETTSILERFPLRLIAQGWAATAGEATFFLQRAADFKAAALNLHLGHAYMTALEAVDLIGQVHREAKFYGVQLLVETHRGRLTQDLFRTAELVKLVPELAIALDLSHYIVAGETFGGSQELFCIHLETVLKQTALIHGRISNGQSIQVAIDDRFSTVEVIKSLWQRAMRAWLSDAPSDAVFVFEPELGPPPYAYLTTTGEETFSREHQSRLLKELAQSAWEAASMDVLAVKGAEV